MGCPPIKTRQVDHHCLTQDVRMIKGAKERFQTWDLYSLNLQDVEAAHMHAQSLHLSCDQVKLQLELFPDAKK